MDRRRHARGLLITSLGVLVLTPDTLLVRLVGLDPWTIAFWRGALMSIALALGLAVVRRRGAVAAFRAIGRTGLFVALLYGVEGILFILALAHTSVANTLIVVSAAPLFAALLSRLFLGEPVILATWLAILATFVGIAIVVWDGLGHGTLAGDAAALATGLCFAGVLVLVRRGRAVNMVPATALGGALGALLVAPVAAPFALHAQDALVLALMGFLVLPVSLALITIGPRYIPAPEVGLLLLLETVLGPLWVHLALGEAAPAGTLIGGAIVVLTLAAHAVHQLRRAG